MWGKRTSLWLNSERVISKDKKGYEIWLTRCNLCKFADKFNMRLFLGNPNIKEWTDEGTYILKQRTKLHKLFRGLSYYKCRLEKVKGE